MKKNKGQRSAAEKPDSRSAARLVKGRILAVRSGIRGGFGNIFSIYKWAHEWGHSFNFQF